MHAQPSLSTIYKVNTHIKPYTSSSIYFITWIIFDQHTCSLPQAHDLLISTSIWLSRQTFLNLNPSFLLSCTSIFSMPSTWRNKRQHMESLGRSKKPEHDSEPLKKEVPGKQPMHHISSLNGSKHYISSHYLLIIYPNSQSFSPRHRCVCLYVYATPGSSQTWNEASFSHKIFSKEPWSVTFITIIDALLTPIRCQLKGQSVTISSTAPIHFFPEYTSSLCFTTSSAEFWWAWLYQ